ncbi:hypothetical protein VFPPC_18122 [Pochonia chlamydosporia 170]|uniref:Uncharacterized protein n=1 Tax=Pochonia chlamydosporia 170 TaxID=1380566 RepID=A0A219AQ23_METCM|nr:hypothetical protein VFPPC_18122 [Pochonia chlamydosporia 170]OWT42709.1 hypothetical protein VFPPC_18122 [Pochonia chlamydosporia 170]
MTSSCRFPILNQAMTFQTEAGCGGCFVPILCASPPRPHHIFTRVPQNRDDMASNGPRNTEHHEYHQRHKNETKSLCSCITGVAVTGYNLMGEPAWLRLAWRP